MSHMHQRAAMSHMQQRAAMSHMQQRAAMSHMQQRAAMGHMQQKAAMSHMQRAAMSHLLQRAGMQAWRMSKEGACWLMDWLPWFPLLLTIQKLVRPAGQVRVVAVAAMVHHSFCLMTWKMAAAVLLPHHPPPQAPHPPPQAPHPPLLHFCEWPSPTCVAALRTMAHKKAHHPLPQTWLHICVWV